MKRRSLLPLMLTLLCLCLLLTACVKKDSDPNDSPEDLAVETTASENEDSPEDLAVESTPAVNEDSGEKKD